MSEALAIRILRPPVVLATAAALAVLPQAARGSLTGPGGTGPDVALEAMPHTVAWDAAARPAAGGRPTGSYLLTATSTGGNYAPAFTGNGYLGLRVPPTGQGYSAGAVPTESVLAGFYAQAPGQVQRRANLPAWSTLAFGDGGRDFSLTTGRVTHWRQQLDLRTGVITTTATWAAPDGHVTDLRYEVFTDRARAAVGIVRLQLSPHWSGTATVTDEMDGTPATLTTGVTAGWDTAARQDWETVRTKGTGTLAGLASQAELSPDAGGVTVRPAGSSGSQTVAQRLGFGVTAGHTYTVTKYVGVVTGRDPAGAAAAARRQARDAAAAGFDHILAENTAAWRALWAGRIDVLGNPALATEVNASEFYLWSSTRDGVDWSIPPGGLSASDYNGHIFWDAETWMYPALLAQHPGLAAGVNGYRLGRLGAAEAHARATGYAGARYPWESALDGTEQTPPPVAVHSEGIYEQHITADIALAQWQYYLATGDRGWLATRGWPVLSRAAAFWASRVAAGPGGTYHIRHVTGPDEENPDVNDEVYTNVAAAATLRDAIAAARVVGASVPPSWATIARRLVVLYQRRPGINPEFSGYRGQMVKQADATMLYYPWEYATSAAAAQRDLDYYVPRTDPGGPSMSDAINSIDTSGLGSPGCASYTYTQRSADPFIRDVFDQFSETKTGGALTFTTGIGGFLQEFLYGYSGLRWSAESVRLDPSLTGQLRGVVLRRLAWKGRVFTVRAGLTGTAVTLQSGPPLPVTVRGVSHTVARGGTLTVPTRRPDRQPTADLARCQPASASSAQPGDGPLAAVDGSPATGWQPRRAASGLTVRLARPATLTGVTLAWGRAWPPPPAPNVHPPPGPVKILRATSYDLLASVDGKRWIVAARVSNRSSGARDGLSFRPVRARYLRLRITGATHGTPPVLAELTAAG